MSEKIAIQPLFSNSMGSVSIRTSLDTRHSQNDAPSPICVIITYQRKRVYYRAGEKATYEEYLSILKAKVTSNSEFAKKKARIEKVHLRVYALIQEMMTDDTFTMIRISERLKNFHGDKDNTFYEHFSRIIGEKKSSKTRNLYQTALVSYFKTLGAKCIKQYDKNGKQLKRYNLDLSGKVLDLKPKDVTALSIVEWKKALEQEGKSASTISMYLRAMKSVLNTLKTENIIKRVPEVKIPVGARRTGNFLTVEQILKLKDYIGPGDNAKDFWLMLYFCNGCNAKDFVALKWGQEYYQDKELSFIRSKTKDKSQSLVLIPVIEPLAQLLLKYASSPKRGAYLFPYLLNGAKTEEEISIQADYLNARIREGMAIVCEKLDLPKASASWARNSYITALTWHGISDAFIDNMTGHTGTNSLLRGYQGRIPPAKRHKINSLLIVPPED